MGLLKRIFSIGSKKGRKTRQQQPIETDYTLAAVEEQEHEAAVGRLLRSSSSRYAVVAEIDYASLPPLPHPINNVVNTPAASTVSLTSSTPSHPTYTVKVHERKQHATTEFPHANRHLDEDPSITPPRLAKSSKGSIVDSPLLRLRSDPSVASLLELYDEHGHLPSQVFSNSPPPTVKKKERPQRRRTGSTLRQLLGNPPTLNSRRGANTNAMGDISWAEHVLGETESTMSLSSLDPPTPQTPIATLCHHMNDITISSDYDLSSATLENPTISSMTVEVSMASELTDTRISSVNHTLTPKPPQSAAEVFDFLTERRPSQRDPYSGSRRGLSSSPYMYHDPPSRFSPDSSVEFTPLPSIAPSTVTRRSTQAPVVAYAADEDGTLILDASVRHRSSQIPVAPGTRTSQRRGNEVKVLMTDPTTVIVTAPTPSSISGGLSPRSSRGHRGQTKKRSPPRPPSNTWRHGSSGGTSPTNRNRNRRSHSKSTPQRSNSVPLVSSNSQVVDKQQSRQHKRKDANPSIGDKENSNHLAAHHEIPTTPMRSSSTSRLLYRSVLTADTNQPRPSDVSSLELSPLAQEMMQMARQGRTQPERRNTSGIPRRTIRI